MERKLRETDRQRQTAKVRDRQRETDRDRVRETDRQRDTERETHTDTERERESFIVHSSSRGQRQREALTGWMGARSEKGRDSHVQHTSLQDHYNVKQ